jgi:hypothetical protein
MTIVTFHASGDNRSSPVELHHSPARNGHDLNRNLKFAPLCWFDFSIRLLRPHTIFIATPQHTPFPPESPDSNQ